MKRMTLMWIVLTGALLAPTGGFAQISCSREGLQRAVDLYVTAQTKGDTSGMPLATGLGYMENVARVDIDNGVIKKSIGKIRDSLRDRHCHVMGIGLAVSCFSNHASAADRMAIRSTAAVKSMRNFLARPCFTSRGAALTGVVRLDCSEITNCAAAIRRPAAGDLSRDTV